MIKERKDTMVTGGKLLPIVSHRIILYKADGEMKLESFSADTDHEAVEYGKKRSGDMYFDCYRCKITADGYYDMQLLYTTRPVDKEFFYVVYKRVVKPNMEIPINHILSAHSSLAGARDAIEAEREMCEAEFIKDTGENPFVSFSNDRLFYWIHNGDYTLYMQLEIWYTEVKD